MSIAGKVFVITGVTTGIGKAAFTGFARAGASALGGARRTDRGEQMAAMAGRWTR